MRFLLVVTILFFYSGKIFAANQKVDMTTSQKNPPKQMNIREDQQTGGPSIVLRDEIRIQRGAPMEQIASQEEISQHVKPTQPGSEQVQQDPQPVYWHESKNTQIPRFMAREVVGGGVSCGSTHDPILHDSL